MAPLSKDEENYVRLALLLKGVTPRAVRTYFDREFPPTHLPSTLKRNKTYYNTLFDLKVKRIINQAQWNLLIPINDQFKKQIEDWEKKDKMFVSTRASTYVIKSLKDNSCLTLTAPSGAGKSFIARHTALILQKAGYKIVPVRQPDDIKNFYQPGEQTVFIIDDICGNFIVNQLEIKNWTHHLPVIDTIIADKCCKIIVACRLQVYKDSKFKILTPFKSCECNITSDKLCLTSEEKNSIANRYIDSELIDIDNLSKNSVFFPLVCSLYNVEKHGDVKEFFKNPFIIYENELDNLSRHGDEGNYKICSLALLVLFNNKLEENWFQGRITNEQTKIIKDICEACEFNSIPKAKLQKELDTLVGTFVSKQDGIYRTIHDKLFDFLTYYFGKKMIQCLIDHGDSRLMQERFIWDTETNKDTHNIDFIIKIPDGHLESYFQRLIQDWSVGKVRVVFNNTNLQMSSLRRKLLKILNQLDKTKQLKLANAKETELPNKDCGYDNTPLILSCYHGYTDIVQWLLNNDVDVHQCRDDGVTGLIMASHKGHTDMVKLLLERNPNVDLCTKDGFSPLLQASTNGHTDVVKLLLKRNPDLDIRSNKGKSPLLLASQNGHTDIVKLLLEKNPSVNLCDPNGCSPLLEASRNGHTDIVKLLLENNPDVDLCCKDGCSPLYWASYTGQTDIVKLLLENNSDVDLCCKDGCSPLYWASYTGHTDIVKSLLEKNPDVNLCCNKGFSPLITASQNGHTDTVRLLLERNPDLCDNTPLSTSYVHNQISISNSSSLVKALVTHKPDINAQTYDGGSALYFGAFNGNLTLTKLLLENNADSNICSYSKQFQTDRIIDNPALTLEHAQRGCFEYLRKNSLSYVADYVSKMSLHYVFDLEADCSSLHIACFMGRTNVVICLLDHNAKINITNEDGITPLFYACEVGHDDTVHVLLDKGADSQIFRHDGKSPLDIATDNGHTLITMMIKEHVVTETHFNL
ncbi:Hypothetical predicted protein [Mytilus galloprovincialis]|uniref:Novel STAND NTPase 3 domain-containing protein n=1 Tax=Mytilus galloprovincialis TaxID=29158 RepID=A0A8B6GKF3_MYTGA|nr:Hypothetical predicted protein [Mytilus galloprovincialis]